MIESGVAPGAYRYRSAGLRAKVAIALLAAMTLVSLASFALDLVGLGLSSRLVNDAGVELEIERFQLGSTVLTFLYLGFLGLTATAFLAWLSRSVDNVPALGGGFPVVSPRWAIGWWFVPVANLVMPIRIMLDLNGRATTERYRGGSGLIVGWWLLWIAGLAAAYWALNIYFAHFGSFPWPRQSETLPDWYAFQTTSAVADALHAASAALAILVVRRIQRGADARETAEGHSRRPATIAQ